MQVSLWVQCHDVVNLVLQEDILSKTTRKCNMNAHGRIPLQTLADHQAFHGIWCKLMQFATTRGSLSCVFRAQCPCLKLYWQESVRWEKVIHATQWFFGTIIVNAMQWNSLAPNNIGGILNDCRSHHQAEMVLPTIFCSLFRFNSKIVDSFLTTTFSAGATKVVEAVFLCPMFGWICCHWLILRFCRADLGWIFEVGVATFRRIAHKFLSEFLQQMYPANFSALFLQGFRNPPPPPENFTPKIPAQNCRIVGIPQKLFTPIFCLPGETNIGQLAQPFMMAHFCKILKCGMPRDVAETQRTVVAVEFCRTASETRQVSVRAQLLWALRHAGTDCHPDQNHFMMIIFLEESITIADTVLDLQGTSSNHRYRLQCPQREDEPIRTPERLLLATN